MARLEYSCPLSDFARFAQAMDYAPLANRPVYFFDASSGGTQLTDLVAVTGTITAGVLAPGYASPSIDVQGPNGYTAAVLWLSTTLTGPRYPLPLANPYAAGSAADSAVAALVASSTSLTGPAVAAKAGAGGGATAPTGPFSYWRAEDQGMIAWTYDPAASNPAATVPAAGQMQMARVHVPAAVTIRNVLLYIGTAGVTLTAGQNFAGLYDATTLALLSLTADQTTNWATTGTKIMPLVTPQAVAAGDYFVAFWSQGTTPPNFYRGAGVLMSNVNLSAPNWRYANGGTGLTTTAPNPVTAFTPSTIAWWAGVS